MDTQRINEILLECTTCFRKGEVSTREDIESQVGGGGVVVVHHYGYPHVSEAEIPTYDTHFLAIGVLPEAEDLGPELRDLLSDYPDRNVDSQEVGYIELGAELGSQELAFRLFAMGQHLEWWIIMTPESMIPQFPDMWDNMAGAGYVTINGLRAMAKASPESS